MTDLNIRTDVSSPVNADPGELEKFSDLAHGWWDPEGEFGALHAINPLRLGWIGGLLLLAGKSIVDVGCGGGILAEAMAREGADVLGIDLATKSLRVARLHALEVVAERLTYREVSAEALAAELPGRFDAVTCMEMLEHVPDPASVVAACARLVKPGGMVFFSSINRNAKAFLFAIVGAEYILDLVPRGTHAYDRLIRPSELARWCRAEELEPLASRGLQYNPLTRRYWLSADTSVNFMLAFRRSAA